MKKSVFDKLNLRPQERRIVVGVGLLLFVIVNIWMVWPRFSDWGEVSAQKEKTEQTLARYRRELANIPVYQRRLEQLQQEGSQVLTKELQLEGIVQSQAAATGLILNRMTRAGRGGGTNQFFEEQALEINYSAGPTSLVNFLVNIASDNSMMRVREFNAQPDPSQTRLAGSMTIVAAFQREQRAAPAPARPSAAAAATNRPPPAKGSTNAPAPPPAGQKQRQTPQPLNTKK